MSRNLVTIGLAVNSVSRKAPERKDAVVASLRKHLSTYPPRYDGCGLGAEIDKLLRTRGIHWDCDLKRQATEWDKYDRIEAEANTPDVVKTVRGYVSAIVTRALDTVTGEPERLILRSHLYPGDILTMTAAVESLHALYPSKFITGVETPVPAIWQSNPRISEVTNGRVIEMHYPSINRCGSESIPFLGGYTEFLQQVLCLPMRLTINRPLLYLSDEEKGWINQVEQHHGHNGPFWLVSAGVKRDYPAKQWPVEFYQEVVDRTRGLITWVQVGSGEHDHPKLNGVIDLRGQTDHRQLIRLAYHSSGGMGPVTYLQHLCAAWQKPYACLAGGREPATWIQYPLQTTFHSIGSLACCKDGGCWKSRVVPLGDGDEKDSSLCVMPVTKHVRPVGKCMELITPSEVVAVLNRLVAAVVNT
jgi:hypothetical protein